jgi:hypothetical protein
MQPLADLTKGLEILEPFLRQHGFVFDNYENGQGLGGQFTIATYTNGLKKFIISYLFSVGQVVYQYDHSLVCHDFYLDQLGLADKKKLPHFQSEDKLLAFNQILLDFDFLIDDFFEGRCVKLIEFSKLQANVISEYRGKTREECDVKLDEDRIKEAREEFKKKEFKKSRDTYSTVEHRNLLNELDNKLIDYDEHHI